MELFRVSGDAETSWLSDFADNRRSRDQKPACQNAWHKYFDFSPESTRIQTDFKLGIPINSSAFSPINSYSGDVDSEKRSLFLVSVVIVRASGFLPGNHCL